MSDATELDVLQPMAAPAPPAAALDRLPRSELGVPELDDDPFWRCSRVIFRDRARRLVALSLATGYTTLALRGIGEAPSYVLERCCQPCCCSAAASRCASRR